MRATTDSLSPFLRSGQPVQGWRRLTRVSHLRAGVFAAPAWVVLKKSTSGQPARPTGTTGANTGEYYCWFRLPVSLVRFSISALTATTSVLPDMESAATSGLSTKGYKTPAASGNASVL